jgi:hypothetical protein
MKLILGSALFPAAPRFTTAKAALRLDVSKVLLSWAQSFKCAVWPDFHHRKQIQDIECANQQSAEGKTRFTVNTAARPSCFMEWNSKLEALLTSAN